VGQTPQGACHWGAVTHLQLFTTFLSRKFPKYTCISRIVPRHPLCCLLFTVTAVYARDSRATHWYVVEKEQT